MSDLFLAGAETGDANEVLKDQVGTTLIDGTSLMSGVYCYKLGNAANLASTPDAFWIRPASATQIGISFRYRTTAQDPGTAQQQIASIRNGLTGTGAGISLLQRGHTNSDTLVLSGVGGMTLSSQIGTTQIQPDTNYTIHIAFDPAAGGIVKLWVDDNLEVDTTHAGAAGTGTVDDYHFAGGNSSTWFHYYDDLWITDVAAKNATTKDSRLIARHSKSGAPTYNAFTKSNASTIDTVWLDTPTSATTEAHSTAASQAQTALVASFSSTQTGHGTEVIASGDTIHAAKVNAYLREIGTGTTRIYSLRRRIASADTDEAKVLTISAALYEMALFAPASLTDLNAMQYGAVRGIGTGKNVQMDDGWVHALYTPASTSINATTSGPLPLGGTIAGTVAVAAATNQSLPLSGTLAATVAETAQSTAALPLSGSVTGTVGDSVDNAASTAPLPLSGTAATTVHVTASSSASLPLGGSAAAQVFENAQSTSALPLSGTAAATVLDTASSSKPLPLAGTTAATVSLAASTTSALPLSGSIATAIGVSVGSSQSLVIGGSVTSVVAVTAQSTQALPLGGSITGTVVSAGAWSSTQPLPLGGSAAFGVLITGIASQALPLAGTVATSVTVSAASSRSLPLSGVITVTGPGPATLISAQALPLSGSAVAADGTNAQSAGALPLGGNISAGLSISAQTSHRLPIGGSIVLYAPGGVVNESLHVTSSGGPRLTIVSASSPRYAVTHAS